MTYTSDQSTSNPILPHVFAVIVTYNAGHLINQCLDSFTHSTYPVEVIVVDNASTDDTLEAVRCFRDVQCITLTENLGFGRANNIGIVQALNQGADYIFLLNQDAEITEGAISRLVLIAQDHPELGILSPIHLNGDGSAIDPGFLQLMASRTPPFISDLCLGRSANFYSVDFINAAAWLCSRKCLLDVGGFDPLFFMYGEDDDLCNRVRFHGYQIGVTPHAIIRHSRQSSRPKFQGSWQQGRANLRRLSEQVKTINTVVLKDPSSPFRFQLRQVVMQTTTDLLVALVHIEWRRMIVLAWGTLKTVASLFAIRRHRQQCLRPDPHWLDIGSSILFSAIAEHRPFQSIQK